MSPTLNSEEDLKEEWLSEMQSIPLVLFIKEELTNLSIQFQTILEEEQLSEKRIFRL